MTHRRGRVTGLIVALAAIVVAALGLRSPVAADTVKTARGFAYGVNTAPVPITQRPNVEAVVPPGPDATAEDSILEVPAEPLATSFTANVQAAASLESTIDAILQTTIAGKAQGVPKKHNARGYAIVEDLQAVTGQIKADVIEAEAVASCVGGKTVLATGTRILNLAVGPQAVPVVNPSPNQVIFNQAGITITFWETNWDPGTKATTDGSDTVFVNALHIKAPGGIDVIASHAEATAQCAAAKKPPKKPGDKPECIDGVDNDGDGEIDFPADPGCDSRQDDDEISDCDDKADNDGDGKIDFPVDPGCESRSDDDETNDGPQQAPPAAPVEAQPAFTG